MIKAKTAADVRDSFNYLTVAELLALREIVLELPPSPVIINIGAGAGTSGLLFAETRGDTYVSTIDITDESSPFGCLEGERLVFEQAGLSHLKNKRWIQYHDDSKAVGKRLLEGDMGQWIDLVFVDGGHTYEGCMCDMEIWGAMVKPGGIMAVHDYQKVEAWSRNNPGTEITDDLIKTVIKPYPGVDEAVKDFLYPAWGNRDWQMESVVDSLAVIRRTK